jgi:polyphenol oxidase
VTEAFPFLNPLRAVPGIRAGWVGRLAALPAHATAVDRDDAMRALAPDHEAAVAGMAGAPGRWIRAEQVHGNMVAVVADPQESAAPPVIAGADGLVTAASGWVLAIHVADCGAIWLADRRTGAIGLLHSGKKGTASNILGVAVATMQREFGSCPADMTAVLGPCIRPPHYEVDFAAEIGRQAQAAGIGHFHDCGENTAADLTRHYSYRMELGKTGRMMAMILREPTP